ACVFPQLRGLVESTVVDGDGEPGVLVARLTAAVFGATGEVALDRDRDPRAHLSSFLSCDTPLGAFPRPWAGVVHASHSCWFVVQERGLSSSCPRAHPPEYARVSRGMARLSRSCHPIGPNPVSAGSNETTCAVCRAESSSTSCPWRYQHAGTTDS